MTSASSPDGITSLLVFVKSGVVYRTSVAERTTRGLRLTTAGPLPTFRIGTAMNKNSPYGHSPGLASIPTSPRPNSALQARCHSEDLKLTTRVLGSDGGTSTRNGRIPARSCPHVARPSNTVTPPKTSVAPAKLSVPIAVHFSQLTSATRPMWGGWYTRLRSTGSTGPRIIAAGRGPIALKRGEV
jgi:hypothetical protein